MVQVQLGPPFAMAQENGEGKRNETSQIKQDVPGTFRGMPGSLTTAYWVIKKKRTGSISCPEGQAETSTLLEKRYLGELRRTLRMGFAGFKRAGEIKL